MGKKEKQPVEHRAPTRRQISRWQRDKRINRIILIAGSLVIVIVLAVLGWGYHQNVYVPHQQDVAKLHKTMAVVDSRSFDLEYFIDALRFLAITSGTEDLASLSEQTVAFIQNFQLIGAEARQRGFQVTSAEIDEILKGSTLEKNKVARELTEYGLLNSKLREAMINEKMPASIPQVEIQAMLLEDDARYGEVVQRLEAGEDFAAVAQELSIDILPVAQRGKSLWLPLAPWGVTETALDEALSGLEVGKLSQPVWDEDAVRTGGYWVIQALPEESEDQQSNSEESSTGSDTSAESDTSNTDTGEPEAKTVTVRAILVATEQKARELRQSIEEGQDMEALVTEHSQHYSVYFGGLVEFTEGDGVMSEAFEEAALALQPGELRVDSLYDGDVNTYGAYWLLRAVNKEDRPADTVVPGDWAVYLNGELAYYSTTFQVREMWETKLFTDWLTETRDKSTLEDHWTDLDQETKDWAIQRVATVE